MLLMKDHLKLLLHLREGAEDALEFRSKGKVSEKSFSRRVTELKVLGLVEIESGKVSLTEAGKILADAISEAQLDLEALPEVWVDTSIEKMVELAVKTGVILDLWEDKLEERGLWKEGKPTKLAEKLMEAKKAARPSLYISTELSDFIEVLPPGPEELNELIRLRDELGFGKWVINALQAMDLLYVSPPDRYGSVYTLTPAGRIARESMWLISVISTQITLDRATAEQIERGETTERLREMGLADRKGITEAGKGMLRAYHEMGVTRVPTTPFYFTLEEVRVLKTVKEAANLRKTNPKILPTKEWIEKRSGIEDVGEALILLESKNLIERREVEGKDSYWLTKFGERALSLVGDAKDDVTSNAVKAITFALAGDVPVAEWVHLAKKHGLVSKDITGKGRALVELSSEVVRRPILTKYDVALLMKIPKGRFVEREKLIREMMDYLEVKDEEEARREFRKAISEAESKGYVIMLQNKAVGLTSIGEVMKDAVTYAKTEVMKGMSFPVTPTIYWVLRVIAENIEELKAAWREGVDVTNVEAKIVYNHLKKYTSVTDEEIKKAFAILRGTGLLGKMGPTSAGELLLEVGKMFERLPAEESWIRPALKQK